MIAGDSPTVTVGAQGTGLRDTTVHWSADTGTSGITVTPASGTLSVSADGRASTQATVSVPDSVASGSYPVSFHFTTSDGQTLPSATVTVTVTSPVQPQQVTPVITQVCLRERWWLAPSSSGLPRRSAGRPDWSSPHRSSVASARAARPPGRCRWRWPTAPTHLGR